ncbi:methyltransferase domain-containing protein [Paenibacillus sp. GCM10012307]|uniref:Methyltransferase domain-containing protein n=1 Tax=Paenibacillus roseus TaxID=2798579 RepID=A0A934MN28_9BACL|nr:MerR family transcriptional regulator [Paenibacillus roseus]MBJ6364015.1 methyltransferase domain-containing protein [Paenibacillus roseus]
MKIREAARKLGISVRAIRYYEERELLTPVKERQSGYRVFSGEDIWRLQTIIALRETGMNTPDIKQALENTATGSPDGLRRYLELHRSVIIKEWLELRQMIDTTEHMLSQLAKQQTVPVEQLFELAIRSRALQQQRRSWEDRWNYDQLAPNHDQTVERSEGVYSDYEQAMDCILSHLSPQPGEAGLDLGTGTGNLAGKLLARGAIMCGVDQSQAMLTQAQQKYPQLETRIGNMLAIPFVEGKFDFAASSFAFRHLTPEQQLLALQEIHRVLRPGGRICIADLMFTSQEAQRQYGGMLQEGSSHAVLLPHLTDWLKEVGYEVQTRRINDLLHIVHAVQQV